MTLHKQNNKWALQTCIPPPPNVGHGVDMEKPGRWGGRTCPFRATPRGEPQKAKITLSTKPKPLNKKNANIPGSSKRVPPGARVFRRAFLPLSRVGPGQGASVGGRGGKAHVARIRGSELEERLLRFYGCDRPGGLRSMRGCGLPSLFCFFSFLVVLRVCLCLKGEARESFDVLICLCLLFSGVGGVPE